MDVTTEQSFNIEPCGQKYIFFKINLKLEPTEANEKYI
jgi:hypothetical protein